MVCPSCQSEEWRLASLVHKEGLSSINTRTSGSAIGVSQGGLGFSSGSARTTGTQQTAISKAASPPSGYLKTIALGIIGFIALIIALINGTTMWMPWIIAMACGYGIYKFFPEEKRIYTEKMARYKVTRMCQRCGTLYIPGE